MFDVVSTVITCGILSHSNTWLLLLLLCIAGSCSNNCVDYWESAEDRFRLLYWQVTDFQYFKNTTYIYLSSSSFMAAHKIRHIKCVQTYKDKINRKCTIKKQHNKHKHKHEKNVEERTLKTQNIKLNSEEENYIYSSIQFYVIHSVNDCDW